MSTITIQPSPILQIGGSLPLVCKVPAPDILFYHQPCPDGLAARVIAENCFGLNKIDFRSWVHGQPHDFTKCDNKVVWFVDVTPSFYDLSLLKTCKEITILDHHANDHMFEIISVLPKMNLPIKATFTTANQCGSLLLFMHLYGEKANIPHWMDAINKGDTNLIHKRTDDEKAYHAWITRHEVMASSDAFRKALSEDVKQATVAGKKLLDARETEVVAALKAIEYSTCPSVDGKSQHPIAYVEASSPQMISMINERVWSTLNPKIDFLVIRWGRNGENQLSLRSPPGSNFNVATIARKYKGDGHPLAAGVQGLTVLA